MPSSPVVKGEPETGAVQLVSVYSPMLQPPRSSPVLVRLMSFTLPLVSLFWKLTEAVPPAVTVTAWGLVLAQAYLTLIAASLWPSSLT